MAQWMGPYVHYPAVKYRASVDDAHKLLQQATKRWAKGETTHPATHEVLQQILDIFIRGEFLRRRFPFGVDQGWMVWNGGVIAQLATAIADERDFALLPVLGDALEDAGCTNSDVLAHCWSGEPHVLGCWVTDVLLNRAESSVRYLPQGLGVERKHAMDLEPVGLQFEDACTQAHEILQTAASEWAEGHPEDPPTKEILTRTLRVFVTENFLRPPYGTEKT